MKKEKRVGEFDKMSKTINDLSDRELIELFCFENQFISKRAMYNPELNDSEKQMLEYYFWGKLSKFNNKNCLRDFWVSPKRKVYLKNYMKN